MWVALWLHSRVRMLKNEDVWVAPQFHSQVSVLRYRTSSLRLQIRRATTANPSQTWPCILSLAYLPTEKQKLVNFLNWQVLTRITTMKKREKSSSRSLLNENQVEVKRTLNLQIIERNQNPPVPWKRSGIRAFCHSVMKRKRANSCLLWSKAMQSKLACQILMKLFVCFESCLALHFYVELLSLGQHCSH